MAEGTSVAGNNLDADPAGATDQRSRHERYRTLETPDANRLRNAHAALDAAVRTAYGM